MSKHTPGPWEVGGGEKGGEPGYVYCDNDLGSAVAIVFGIPALRWSVFPREEEEANARLIAASPKLLEACKAAEEWLSGWVSASPYIEVIRAAIQEAEGPIAGGEPVRSEAEPGHTPAQTNKGEGCAALFLEGEDKQARATPSAPITTDTKDTTK